MGDPLAAPTSPAAVSPYEAVEYGGSWKITFRMESCRGLPYCGDWIYRSSFFTMRLVADADGYTGTVHIRDETSPSTEHSNAKGS